MRTTEDEHPGTGKGKGKGWMDVRNVVAELLIDMGRGVRSRKSLVAEGCRSFGGKTLEEEESEMSWKMMRMRVYKIVFPLHMHSAIMWLFQILIKSS